MKYFTFKHRLGFTLIELVMAIVVIGILAALAMPRLDRDLTQEAADSILSDIRYTQHLALMDDMYEHNDTQWQQKYWRIVFSSCDSNNKHFYMVGSDTSEDSANNAFFALSEAAIDPSNNKRMFGTPALCLTDGDATVSDRMYITKKYGISNVTSAGGCAGAKHIAFDHLGRPHHGTGFSQSTVPDYAGYMTNACIFTFTLSDNATTFQIEIAPETGYAHIVNQDDS